jgi:3(or 17)beta-hydroxysteroid dehydrogenase
MRVAGKVVIISGGAGGIGAETASMLIREGATVVITDVSDHVGAETAKKIGAQFLHHDVAIESQWTDIVTSVLAQHGKVDVLVNAAGIEGDPASDGGLNTTLAEWRRVMSINLDGTFLGCRAVLPRMLEKGTGSIVNISSVVAYFATPATLSYGASKAGVQQLSRSMAQLGGSSGKRVRCNSVHPGIIRTRMTDSIINNLATRSNVSMEEAEAMILGGVLFGARGTPKDVTHLILYLASDESSFITGSEFQVDGGWHIVAAG